MSVVIISNSYPLTRYYNKEIPQQIKDLNLKPIFMYNLDYSNNSEIQLYDDNKTSLYEKIISFNYNDIEKTIHKLKNLNVIAIIPYTEDDVIDAEYLSNCIGTPSNPIETSLARRNKYIMQEKIKEYGLNSIKQQKCKEVSDIIEFVNNNPNIKYVIKPLDGCGSEDVYLCDNVEQLVDKFNIIINKKNNCYVLNTSCLLQEYIDGEDWGNISSWKKKYDNAISEILSNK
jgi:glutathione synthase/RimK-type ligase-like ATP-grasp enzyme